MHPETLGSFTVQPWSDRCAIELAFRKGNNRTHMDSDSHNSGKQKAQSNRQDDTRISTLVQNAAANFIERLQKADPIRYERPKVTLIDKQGAKTQTQVSSHLHEEAARTFIKKLQETKKTDQM
jgi:hypothetical protein